jgi:dihydrofolate synthase/folylpolyglutamate synthase
MGVSSSTRASDRLLAELKTLHPLLIDLSLGRMRRLLDKLGKPERRLPPVVHIAGTNGKGSTTAYLKAITEAAGKRCHVYTSPHLVRFHERIALAGADGIARPIGEDALVDVLTRVARINAGDNITFFEITTAAALVAFSETPADAVLLEVGLGGDFDSTNVVDRPALSIITPVSMDHAEKLGHTLARIAASKAGILKPDCQAVISQQESEALDVIRARARAVRAPILVWGEDFDAYEQNGRLVYQTEDEVLDLPLPALMGRHQIVNAGAVVAASQNLAPLLGLTTDAIAKGLRTVIWPARMQQLGSGRLATLAGPHAELWLDGGHNPAGGAAMAQTLADLEEKRSKPLTLIVGMLASKDAANFLKPFAGLAHGIITVPIPGAHEKPMPPADLAALAVKLGFRAETATDVPTALERLARRNPAPHRVLITGSLYLAGHVLAFDQGATAKAT